MATNPYAIDFNTIPWGNAGASMFGALGGSPQQAMASLGPAYAGSYNDYLNFAKAQGQQINAGYNNAMAQQIGGQSGVMDTIANYGKSAAQQIKDTSAAQQGAAQQSLIGRGLGNFTVLDASRRGINADAMKQNLQLADQLAAMKAGYQNQFIGQNTNLAGQQLNFLERMTGQPPSAALYGQLAQQFGAGMRGMADQSQVQDALGRLQAAGNPQRVSGGIGAGGQGRPQQAFSPPYGYQGSTPGYGSGIGAGVGAAAYGGANPFFAGDVGTQSDTSTDFGSWSDPFGFVSSGLQDTSNDISAYSGYDPSLADTYQAMGDANPYEGYDPSLDSFYQSVDAYGYGSGAGDWSY